MNVRTAFSLLYPPILGEFGWPRADTAAIFSVGFATSMLITPFIGVAVNRLGPGVVMATGSVLVGGGLVLATFAGGQSLIFLSLGCAVVGGAIILGYTGHAYLMPFWFVRRRGLATGLAFSGAGVGSILLFPWWQDIIREDGWREACLTMALILFVLVLPLNLLLQRRRPEDMGLRPDGGRAAQTASVEPAGSASEKSAAVPDTVVDAEWAARDWSLREAMLTARFWWLGLGLFFGMYVWYAVQVHQTQYLGEIGFSATAAAFALGLVGLFGVVGQIGMGGLSDRIGREWAWTLSTLGFAVCYALLILMRENPSQLLLWLMVAGQGALGYGLASVFGAIPGRGVPVPPLRPDLRRLRHDHFARRRLRPVAHRRTLRPDGQLRPGLVGRARRLRASRSWACGWARRAKCGWFRGSQSGGRPEGPTKSASRGPRR